MKSKFKTELFDCQWVPAKRSVIRAVKQVRERDIVQLSSAKITVVLHGRGDSLRAFTEIQTELRTPEMNFLLLNAPKRCDDGFSWYSSEPNHKAGVCEVRARLFELVNELKAHGFKSENIFWMGHSQGCLIACDLVLNHPDRFGGLIGVSGYLWFFKGWKSKLLQSGAYGTPWLITHGTRDRIIRPSEIRADIAALEASGIPVLYREFAKGHDFDFSHEVPFIRKWLKMRQIESAAVYS